MRNLFISFILVFVLFLSGCVVTKIHTMPVEQFSASYDDVWDAALVYLNKQKEPIVAADKEKGIIYTDWVNEQKVFVTKRYRYNIQIQKIGEEEVQVGIASPQEAYSMGDWEEILPHERKARRMFWAIKRNIKAKRTTYETIGKRPFNRRTKGITRGNR